MNTPNKLTIARVIMIPFFVAFLMYDIAGSAGNGLPLQFLLLPALRIPWMVIWQGEITWLQTLENLWILLLTNCWFVLHSFALLPLEHFLHGSLS